MAGNIKGITIEFRGETTKLDKALRDINNNTKSLDKELKQVNNALKFNPSSVELWRQKQQLLTEKVEQTKDKLKALKDAQAQMDASGVDKNSKEYRELQRQIITTENQVKNFEGQLKKIGQVNLRATSEKFKEIGSSLESAGQKMQGLSMAAAGLVASLGAAAYKAGTAADDLNTLSKVTGIGTEELQKYSYAADLVDVSTETIAKANKKLTKNAYEAANGSKAQAEAFDKIGVSVTDANGELRDSEAIFQDVVGALGKMTNETERDAIAQTLMGKSAAELNPLIEDGGETYKMVADTLAKYNLDYIDQETLDKANEFNDSIDTMKLLGSVAFAQVGSALASTLAPALEKVVDYVGKFAEWLGNLDPKILTVVGSIAAVVAAIAPVLIVAGKLAFAISSITGLMATAGPVIAGIAGPIGIIIGIIAAVVIAFKLWQKHGDKIKKFFADFGAKLGEIWSTLKENILGAVDAIKEGVTQRWDAIKTAVSNTVTAIKTAITTAFTAIKSFLGMIITGYVALVRAQFTLIKTTITTIVNGIKIVITTVFNAIKLFLQTVVNGWKNILTTAWTGIKTATTTAWNAIKNAITSPIQAAKTTLSGIVAAIKSAFSFGGIAGTVKTAFNAVKTAIVSPLQTARDTIKGIIDRIKGFFNFKISAPKIPLPHFSISPSGWKIGDLLKGSIPRLSVSWYKTGGIFDSPSVIGVGEAGPEAVVPLDKFWNKLDKMQMGGNEITINVYAAQGMDVKDLAAEVERRLIESQNRRRLAWQ